MKRALTVCTVAALLLMASVSLMHVETGFSLFMSTDIDHVVARLIIVSALLAILIIPPPRVRALRIVLIMTSLLVISFAVTQTITYQLGLLDSVAYFLAGLLLSIDAFEVDMEAPRGVHFTKPRQI